MQDVVEDGHLLVFDVPAMIAAGVHSTLYGVVDPIRDGKHALRWAVVIIQRCAIGESFPTEIAESGLLPFLKL